jgi:sugar phosphate isomerase/epimerase
MIIFTRRSFLKRGITLAGAMGLISDKHAAAPFKIGACDWSIGHSSDIGAFDTAKQIGVDGIMVDIGSPENNLHIRQKEIQQQYLRKSAETGIKISSIAIGALNNYPYKSDPQTDEWVWDSVDVASAFSVPAILLAFFHKNDLRNDEQGIKETIRKLKTVAPKAEKANVILGIESYLNGADHLRIMDAVGSPNVKVYMDFRNTQDAGWDVLKELKTIGTENICELHMKENGKLLGKGDVPLKKICEYLKEKNYRGDGWMQIESSHPGKDVIADYQENLKFLRDLFNA